ncbi:hypothetical protein A245_32403 [Pseudomonas syringae pv. actinidiae ICMP 19096]|uniref:Uncharacterized protein n=1 Tax=Pseudomonas syringae pv. actinidiae ICMP 19096 TaxID=1194405 RepID=A0A656JQW9_PSESF|nr:hypothetical protein A245_32403 [Pseudomonas syringae pv. actinidiae ICMP 19096]
MYAFLVGTRSVRPFGCKAVSLFTKALFQAVHLQRMYAFPVGANLFAKALFLMINLQWMYRPRIAAPVAPTAFGQNQKRACALRRL